MSRECCCGGRCGELPVVGLSRREFLEQVAAGTATVAVASQWAWANPGVNTAPARVDPAKLQGWRYPLTPARVYRGKNLEAVSMPIGGIGTGSIWLDGQGRLAVWQIFNNLNETRLPDSFFAVRARTGDKPAVVRVLQTVAEGPLAPVQWLDYEGGYPIARLTFQDEALPVQVQMEAFNPLIPTDTANSSIPCAIFRLTARNLSQTPTEVSFLAALQNAVGSQGHGHRGVRVGGYGGNRNRVVRDPKTVSIVMDKSPDPVATGPIKVRSQDGPEVPGPELFWLADVPDLTAPVAETLARIASDGGTVLAAGVQPAFFKTVAALRANRGPEDLATVFEDFERDNYEGWKIEGEAFGKKPSRGTEVGQQPVTGFAGRRLVNTFIAGDGPQGKATSKPFQIEKRYIGFLIGGGAQAGRTCMNLRIGDRVVRTAVGKNLEALEPASWEVAEFKGQNAVLEIVDRSSDGWGHINIDQIIFSDVPPEALLRQGTTSDVAAKAVQLPFSSAETVTRPKGQPAAVTAAGPEALKSAGAWTVSSFTRLDGLTPGAKGYRVLATAEDGAPLIIEGPLGKGRIILALAGRLPWNWGAALLTACGGRNVQAGQRLVSGAPGGGTMALVALDPAAVAAPGWTDAAKVPWETLAHGAAGDRAAELLVETAASEPGSGATVNGLLAVPFKLAPGQQQTVTFALTWHFPNVQRFQHAGNMYSRRWLDAAAVAKYVADNASALWDRTRLYHETVYQSNLPEEFLDAMTSQSVILRGPTCFWSEDGYFGGFEGSYGCCPLNCTHVWNYAQSHARLFPEVGHNMRLSDFITYLHESGETSHRQHGPHTAFIDGHCACIEAALREHQLSPDLSFLEKIWPGVKKSIDWVIEAVDKDRDGIPAGHQWNTYDTAVSGANTFIGSQYLSALAAGEKMASVMKDDESAKRWRTVREAGMKNQNEKLWNGEYYKQIPEPKPASDYDNGCHADQLLGQWWAHMLNLGYLYPVDRVKKALEAVMQFNFRENFVGFKQDPRRYVLDDEGGLVICTWPHKDRPKPFILYADEVWTGIEYSTAGAMIYEGLIEPARRIVRTARARYDGRLRDTLNSGPGGNPYNELECGKFYARAMSSWSLLIASQGLLLEGPRGLLGFKPKWQPEDHRSFYTAPEGWGLFVQRREGQKQTERIEVRHGKLRLRELVFELPANAGQVTATVTAAGKPVTVALKRTGAEAQLVLEAELTLVDGESLDVTFQS